MNTILVDICAILRVNFKCRLRILFFYAIVAIILVCNQGISASASSSSSSSPPPLPPPPPPPPPPITSTQDDYDDDDDHHHHHPRSQPYRKHDDGKDSMENDHENTEDNDDDDDNVQERARVRDSASEHETPRKVAVKVRLRGDLATPAPDAGIELGFVPKQIYYQVRRYDTQQHLPRSAAIDEAETAEELMNAPRLREVVSHKKTQQVYEEQGYEDAAYDHAGYKKAAQHHENIGFVTGGDKHHNDDDDDGDVDSSNRRARIDNDDDQEDSSVNKNTSSTRSTGAAVAATTTTTTTATATTVAVTSDNDTTDVVESDERNNNNNNNNKAKSRSGNWRKTKPKTVIEPAESVHKWRDEPRLDGSAEQDEQFSRKRTKIRASTARSRQKAKNTVKTEKDVAEASESESPSPSQPTHSVSYVKRRKMKNNSSLAKGGGVKSMQEPKGAQSKLVGANESGDQKRLQLVVTPTTYRPSTLPETLTRLRSAAIKRRPALASTPSGSWMPDERRTASASSTTPATSSFAKNMLIDSSGYVFENPFSSWLDSHQVHVQSYGRTARPPPPPLPLSSKSKFIVGSGGGGSSSSVEYAASNERPYNYNGNVYSMKAAATSGDAAASFAKSKLSPAASKTKNFPYEIVEPYDGAALPPPALGPSFQSPKKWRKEMATTAHLPLKHKTKMKFPYEIVTSSSSSSSSHNADVEDKNWWSSTQQTNRKRSKFYTPPKDDSPWIPITAKEAYDIHGYTANAGRQNITPTTSQISVTEWPTESTAEAGALAKKRRKMDPIRVLDQGATATSSPSSLPSTLATSKGLRSQNRVISTSYSIEHEYDGRKAVRPPTNDRLDTSIRHRHLPLQRHRFDGWRPPPPPPPQIDDNFHLQQKLLDDATDSQSQRPSTSLSKSRDESHQPAQKELEPDTDIETLSSNRYVVFQHLEYTTRPMPPLPHRDSFSTQSDQLLQYRHPYLPRETSHLQQSVMSLQPQHESSSPSSTLHSSRSYQKNKRGDTGSKDDDEDDESVKNNANTTSALASTSTLDTPTTIATVTTLDARRNLTQHGRNDSTLAESKLVPKLDKIIVYPVDYASSASFVENLTLAHYADPSNTVRAALPPNYRHRLHTLNDHFDRNGDAVTRRIRSAAAAAAAAATNPQLLNVYMDGSTTEIMVDVDKYPFYRSADAAAGSLAKYSVLRYISNPNTVPTKKAGQMSFYQSTNGVRCPEPDAPHEVAPTRTSDGQWIGDADIKGKPRVRNVGNSILCHKIKFFGHDPLDNPFFKEQTVGFPEIFHSPTSDKKRRRGRGSKENGRKKSVTKREARMASTQRRLQRYRNVQDDDDDIVGAPAKKMVRKVYLAGGFINIQGNGTKFNDKTGAVATAAAAEDALETAAATAVHPPSSNGSTSSFSADDDQISTTSTIQMSSGNGNGHGHFDISASSWSSFKPQYKEPSWRNRSHQNDNDDDKRQRHPLPSSPHIDIKDSHGGGGGGGAEVDSLLYVIHPDSGRGKWMKIVKVESLPDTKVNSSVDDQRQLGGLQLPSTTMTTTKTANSKSVGNRLAPSNELTLHRDSCDNNNDYTDADVNVNGFGKGNGRVQRQRERFSLETTQPNEKQIINISASSGHDNGVSQPQYDIRHISGLLRQVAPLKASQAEINNLQITEELLGDDADADVDTAIDADATTDDVNLNNNNDGDDDDDKPATDTGTRTANAKAKPKQFYLDKQKQNKDDVSFPQPHERLYYYVVDE